MEPYLLSALTRLTSVSTSQRAKLLSKPRLLEDLRRGFRPPGLPPTLSKAVAKLDWETAEREDREIEERGTTILAWGGPGYPEGLMSLVDPPPALYVRGDPAVLSTPSIAVVGSRLSTVYGQNVARTLAADLVKAGLVVVSGLARGIDSAAHEGSLSVPRRAVAVLGTGIDVCYPRENEELMGRILKAGGAVLTEFPPGWSPRPRNFPVRNRVIAGISLGALVVEATERSGSLITARFAAETGREVFAVPHNITSRTGIGPNSLIQKGAKLVQRVEDLLEELPESVRCNLKPSTPGASPGAVCPSLSPGASALLSALKPDEAAGIDGLCGATGFAAQKVLTSLLELQMAGLCVELPGMRYARKTSSSKEPA